MVIRALSDGTEVDRRTGRMIELTPVEDLWRKISQLVSLRRFSTRRIERVLPHLALTGASGVERLGEHLTGGSRTVEGYVRGVGLDELMDEARMIDDPEGAVIVHEARFWKPEHDSEETPLALVSVDCARSAVSRVNRVGVRELTKLRGQWLQTHM
jgi:hypothetical protein